VVTFTSNNKPITPQLMIPKSEVSLREREFIAIGECFLRHERGLLDQLPAETTNMPVATAGCNNQLVGTSRERRMP
jgi:hypothetical protein